jgi:hypothetical protein
MGTLQPFNVALNDDIRGVFNRMFTVPAQIANWIADREQAAIVPESTVGAQIYDRSSQRSSTGQRQLPPVLPTAAPTRSHFSRRQASGLDKKKIERAPIIEVIKKQPKEIMLSALLRTSEQAPAFIFNTFIFAYAVDTLHMSRNLILTAVIVAACVACVTIPLSGHISDRIGRRKIYLIGAASMGLFGFLYFAMVDTAIPTAVFIAIVLSQIPINAQYGTEAALIAEAFTPRLRYSGSSLGFHLASVFAGGPAPLIATALSPHIILASRFRFTSPSARWSA